MWFVKIVKISHLGFFATSVMDGRKIPSHLQPDTTPHWSLLAQSLKKCCVINRLVSWVASICSVCVRVCSVLYFLSQQAPRACQCCGFHGNKRRNVAANSKQLVDKAKTHCAELFHSQSEQARGCKSCFHPGSACARATMKQTASGSCTCYQQQQLPKPFLTARPVQ